MLDSAVLLLNQNYEPLSTCSARRAIVMVWMGTAEMIESTGSVVCSISMKFDVPAIIRLLIYVRITHKSTIQLSKQNILKRDHRTCQYCGKQDGQMTIDHIVPRALGGGESWGNLVCACSSCNTRKGSRSLHEAEMDLIRKPKKPNLRSFIFHNKGKIHSTWRAYIKIG